VVESFLAAGHEVLSIDVAEPQNSEHSKVFRKLDILDVSSLTRGYSFLKETIHLPDLMSDQAGVASASSQPSTADGTSSKGGLSTWDFNIVTSNTLRGE